MKNQKNFFTISKNIFYISVCLSFIYSCKTEDHIKNEDLIKSEFIRKKLVLSAEKTQKDSIRIIGKFSFKNPEVPMEDTLVMKKNKEIFTITPKGLFYTNNPDSIQLNTEVIVKEAVLAEDSSFYYLFFSDTDYQYSGSQLQKIQKDSFESKYSLQTGGGQLGIIKILDNHAYITNFGLVAKINLISGTFNWKHQDLYEPGSESFNSFDSIIKNKNNITFLSRNFFNKKIDTVKVDDDSGQIILIN